LRCDDDDDDDDDDEDRDKPGEMISEQQHLSYDGRSGGGDCDAAAAVHHNVGWQLVVTRRSPGLRNKQWTLLMLAYL
jgi:hypothetical protein